MDAPHPPRSDDPAGIVALDRDALVRDVAGGPPTSPDAWIEQRMTAESRTRDECREELLNAIARGDVAIVRAGDAAER